MWRQQDLWLAACVCYYKLLMTALKTTLISLSLQHHTVTSSFHFCLARHLCCVYKHPKSSTSTEFHNVFIFCDFYSSAYFIPLYSICSSFSLFVFPSIALFLYATFAWSHFKQSLYRPNRNQKAEKFLLFSWLIVITNVGNN